MSAGAREGCASTQHGLDLDAPHSLLDGLQEAFVLRIQVAVLVGVHVSEGTHIGVKVLFTYWLLENRTKLANPVHEVGPTQWKPMGALQIQSPHYPRQGQADEAALGNNIG